MRPSRITRRRLLSGTRVLPRVPTRPPAHAPAYPRKAHVSVTSCAGSGTSSSVVPSLQLVVERVALHGHTARGSDEADELLDLLLRRRARPRRMEDLLA